MLECMLNHAFKWRFYKIAWWITWFNNIGTFFFLIPSVLGYFMTESFSKNLRMFTFVVILLDFSKIAFYPSYTLNTFNLIP